MQNNCSREDITYAGFWVRLAAYVIDSVIVFAGLLIVRLLMSGVMALLDGTALDGNILFHYTLKDIVLYIFQVLYFILLTYCTGTTLGKRLMNLRVVPADGSEKLTLLNVVYRETVGRFLCGISIGIGYLVAGIDRQKRGIHDMLCDTRVIYAKKVKVYPVYQQPVQPMPPQPQAMEQSVRPPQPSVSSDQIPPQDYTGSYHMVRPDEKDQSGEDKRERDS